MKRRSKSQPIRAAKKPESIVAILADVSIQAGAVEGESKGPPTFDVTAYTGVAIDIHGWDLPVVIDLAGMQFGKSLVANLDHNRSQRVGHVTSKSKADGKLQLSGVASAATPWRDEVVNSAATGFSWQASIEARTDKVVEVAAGKTVQANGHEFNGPLYLIKKSTLSGFAFVSHGADDNTTATIAAIAAQQKGKTMKPEVRAWAEAMLPGMDFDDLTPEQVKGIEANHAGQQHHHGLPVKRPKLEEGAEARQVEVDRQDAITEIALNACDKRPYDIKAIKELAQGAIDAKWAVDKFRMELLEASLPPAHTVFRTRKDDRMSNKVIEAAICAGGRLGNLDKHFDDQTLQAAHDRFKSGIGMKQLFLMCAEANGYHGSYANDVSLDVQRAAFGMQGPRQIHATGFSTLDISTIISGTANKFLRDGWMAVDMTPLQVASVRSVRNFQQITTVSLTGDLQFEKLGPAGEIKHGTLGEETYTNKADTYARMLAITRQDLINDDLGALTAIPKRLGRGAALKLNDIFWTEFLDNGSFFTSGNNNVNTGVADMTVGGLAATEVIFNAQTDPDGKPLGVSPAILLVPPALKAAAMTLMSSERLIDGTGTAIQGDSNIYRGRFKVLSSQYMANSTYTGYSAAAWYMLADPNDVPVIEIVALNGKVEPTIESADADFNVLGVQMRGYSDIGVALQEFRGGVRADGGAS